MAGKSAVYVYRWFIPTVEIEEDHPTAFLIRQMSKRDIDAVQDKKQSTALLQMMSEYMEDEETSERVKGYLDRVVADQGFNRDIYGNCIKEIKNIYINDEFKESITDRKEIVDFVAGLEDVSVGQELDSVLWRESVLDEVELQNFTPQSGTGTVCRIQVEKKEKDDQTAKPAKQETLL